MKIAAIVCEFNPLHNGHARLLSLARERADAVVCVMSGSVVQRGELALLDKYTRAVHAVRAGADLVLELPAQYTLSGAPQFAAGAVAIANALNGETTLFFGSECGDAATLKTAAEMLSSDAVNSEIARLMATGSSYPSAVSAAAKTCASTDVDRAAAQALDSPNNVLGIEYIKAIIDTGSKIDCDTIARPGYDARLAPTSSQVRKDALAGTDVSPSIPDGVARSIAGFAPSFAARDDRLFALIKYLVPHAQSGIHDDREGLSDRLRHAASAASSLAEYLESAKVKRYPMARIKRLTLNTLIGNKNMHSDLVGHAPEYVNVLAAKKTSADALLSGVKAAVCATRRDLERFEEEFSLTARADDLFEAVCYPFARNARFV